MTIEVSEFDASSEEMIPKPKSLIFLGTGTSGGVPSIACLTNPERQCRVCQSTQTPEGLKNYRRNTSAAIKLETGTDDHRFILIDCGKSFNHSAITFFPQFGMNRVDALLLTHDHADACFGLDDLRSLTLTDHRAPIQTHVPVYTSPVTLAAISNMFPYMVDASKATGGGAVPSFVWYTFDPDANSFEIPSCGNLKVVPLPVVHGKYHYKGEKEEPYMCMGFRIGDMSYISDVNEVPEETKMKIDGTRILIIDALRQRPHPSHFGFDQAKEFMLSLSPLPEITYWIGMTHETDHYELQVHLEQWSKENGVQIVAAYDGLEIPL